MTSLFALALVHLLALTPTYANEKSALESSCAMQIAGFVKTAHNSAGALKNPVFSKTTDAEFIKSLEESEALTRQTPDPTLKGKLDQKLAALAALTKKAAAKPHGLCVAYLEELTKQVFVACPDFVRDQNDPAKSEQCKQKANAAPATKTAFNAWTSAGAQLISKKK